MRFLIIFFICLFFTKGYANDMELSGIDISQFNEEFKPQDDFYDYVNHNWLSKTEIPDDQMQGNGCVTVGKLPAELDIPNAATLKKLQGYSGEFNWLATRT